MCGVHAEQDQRHLHQTCAYIFVHFFNYIIQILGVRSWNLVFFQDFFLCFLHLFAIENDALAVCQLKAHVPVGDLHTPYTIQYKLAYYFLVGKFRRIVGEGILYFKPQNCSNIAHIAAPH